MRRSSCWPTASRSWPTRGGIRYPRWPRPATTCLAPDQRGYGGSSKPEAVDAYNVVELSADIVGLLDDVDAERAVLVGHDFGGVVAWTAPLLHPDRFAGVAGLSVPPVPRPRVPTTQAFRKFFGENFFYILYFQEPGSGRRRVEPRSGHHAQTADGLARVRRRSRGATDARTRSRRLHRPHSRTGRLARLDQPGRIRPLRRRIHPHRLHRTAELVSLLRSQLGADGGDAGRDDRRCRRCSSAGPPTRRWPTRPATASAKWSPAITAR